MTKGSGRARKRASGTALWGLAFGSALVLTYFVFDSVVYRDVVYCLLSLAAAAAIVAGVRRSRPDQPQPWLLLATAMVGFFCGNATYLYYEVLREEAIPYPSIADAFFIGSLLLAGMSLVGIIRGRGRGDGHQLIDAGIVGTTVALIGWIAIMKPYLDVTSMGGSTVTMLYLAAYVFNAAALTRQVMGGGPRPIALRIAEGSLGLLTVGLMVFAALSAHGRYFTGHLIDAPILFSLVGMGVAALHPSLGDVSRPQEGLRRGISSPMVAMYLITLAAGPLTLVLQRNTLDPGELVVLLLGTMLVSALVVVRLSRLVNDVHESEQARAITETRYRDLVEGLPGAVYVADVGIYGHWHFVSPRIEELLGYSVEEWLEDPGMWFASIVEEDRELVAAAEARAAEEVDGEFFAEYRMRRADGSTIWVRDRAAVLSDGGALQGVLVDITAAKLDQERLKLADERHAALIRNSSDIIIVVEPGGTVSLASASVRRLTGFDPEQIVGRSAFELIHPDDKDAVEAVFNDIIAAGALGAEALLEARTRMRDGDWLWVEIHASNALDDPAVGGIIINVRDISRRKRDEELLQAGSARRDAMLSAALDAIVSIDGDGRIVEFNASAERVFGYESGFAYGKQASELLVPPERRDQLAQGFRSHLDASEGRVLQQRMELDALRADGSTFPAEITIGKADVAGQPYFTAFIRDLTRQKEEEARSRELEHQAERSQRLETVGQLAGGIAHDFNNILAVIHNYAFFVHDGLAEDDPARLDCEEIISAAKKAADMTQQLLVFARREPTPSAIVDVNQVIGELHGLLRRTLREDIDLRIGLADEPLQVNGDRSRIEQVVLNLVVNARDAIEGTGTIAVTTQRIALGDSPTATAAGMGPGSVVSIEVSDTGSGIAEGLKARIFDPFFTTKEKTGGTGLGLATVYGIVKDAGGDISVRTEAGLGSTFTVLLPYVHGDVSRSTSPSQEEVLSIRRDHTVLLVEDEPAVRSSVRRLLERGGCKVIAPESPRAAVELVESGRAAPDVLLTDIVMPGMSGREVADRLNLPTVFMSGYAQEGTLEEGMILVQKPFSPSDLFSALDVVTAGAGERVGRQGIEP